MLLTCLSIFIRIVSNSSLNVFQKLLSLKGQKSSAINFYTYLGLTILGLVFWQQFNFVILKLTLIMGFLGCSGNYFIIRSLSIGELSALAPINSYKPVIALLFGVIFLHEIPGANAIGGMILIIIGTYFVLETNWKFNKAAILYRVLALIFSALEAIVIKKIILITNVTEAFVLWALAGLLFSSFFVLISGHKPIIKSYTYQFLLILSVGIMQYSTNFVFSQMNVSYALALFQLSTILSVFLGVNIFKEKSLKRKLFGSIVMVIGAVLIILAL